MHCDACDLAIRGRFFANEFATLGEDDLHFLRIFVLCEGRIREMESALGVSYPSIKARLAQLKGALAAATPRPETAKVIRPQDPAPAEGTAAGDRSGAILKELESGRLSFDAAMAELKKIQQKDQSK
jgi:hypothetical protein